MPKDLPKRDEMVVISHCPHCGAPIYAKGKPVGTLPPQTIFGCDCNRLVKERLLQPYFSYPSVVSSWPTYYGGTGEAPILTDAVGTPGTPLLDISGSATTGVPIATDQMHYS